MDRQLTAAMGTALTDPTVRPTLLVEMDFPSGTVRKTTNHRDLDFAGNTFAGDGVLYGVDSFLEDDQVASNGIIVLISGNDTTFRSLVFSDFFLGRRIVVWLGLFNSARALIETPEVMFGGFLEAVEVADELEEPIIALMCENRSRDVTIPNEGRYSDEEQLLRFPGDTSLRFVDSIQSAILRTDT